MKGEPEAAVRPDLQVLIGELLSIDIWQSGEAAEDEHVPDLLQPLGFKLLLHDLIQLGLSQVAAVHLIEVQVLQLERIAVHPAVVPCHFIDT